MSILCWHQVLLKNVVLGLNRLRRMNRASHFPFRQAVLALYNAGHTFALVVLMAADGKDQMTIRRR